MNADVLGLSPFVDNGPRVDGVRPLKRNPFPWTCAFWKPSVVGRCGRSANAVESQAMKTTEGSAKA